VAIIFLGRRIYRRVFLVDMFFLLIVLVFGCLHQQMYWIGRAKVFFFQFYLHFINKGCQWLHTMCRWSLFGDVVFNKWGSLRLGLLSGGPPLSLFDMLLATWEGSRT
jgi:hypothetical protein